MSPKLETLLTFGHGTLSADDFTALVRGSRIARIVDVRTIPRSRRHPHFGRDEMVQWVPERAGSAYVWQPALGGFRQVQPASRNVALQNPSFRAYADYMESDTFREALHELLRESTHVRTAIMCSETLWWRCHRRLIADAAALLHGARVAHVMHAGKLSLHVPTRGVRVLDSGTLRYDVAPEASA